MNSQGPPSDYPRTVLPYVLAFVLIMLILAVAWVLATSGHRIV